MLLVDDDVVAIKDGFICVGKRAAYRIAEVESYALQAAKLPLPGGGDLQAAVALLVLHAERRTDDRTLLAERLTAYETSRLLART